jgi:glucosamine-6-phosphate deaminase
MLKKEFSVDKLNVRIYDDRKSMGQAAADDAIAYLKELLAKQDEVWCIFAAAPSQNDVLAAVVAAEGVDWTRVHAIHMDEYVNLAEDAPQGFGNFLRRAVFDHLPFAGVEYIGSMGDPQEKMDRYTTILNEHKIDIVFMGIGENGHIAFNDPHVADFNDPLKIKMVDLDLKCRQQQVNDGCFARLEDVPTHALTLTVPTLFSGGRLFCVVPAPTKADAVRATVEGPVSEVCPATVMRRHDNATLYCDSDSARYIL